ncbi:GspH/FimT family pseudopilin [Inhella crocodyli]|nr:GspH/FimT family pseudopilin [Inhella crocodyli]
MLMRASPRRGFTVIEAMVVVTILGVMIAWGVPAFATWMDNIRIRGTAESILSGLQYSRAEATARNASVRFQLVTDLSATCQRTSIGSNWVVDLVDAADDSVEGNCQLNPINDTPAAPSILQKKPARDGTGSTRVEGSAANRAITEVVFNGLGRLTPVPSGEIEFAVTGANTNQCRESGGDLTCLRVLVSPAGQVRMCSDSVPIGDPQRC